MNSLQRVCSGAELKVLYLPACGCKPITDGGELNQPERATANLSTCAYCMDLILLHRTAYSVPPEVLGRGRQLIYVRSPRNQLNGAEVSSANTTWSGYAWHSLGCDINSVVCIQ